MSPHEAVRRAAPFRQPAPPPSVVVPKLVDISGAAAILQCSKRQARYWVASGMIPVLRFPDRKLRVEVAALIALIEKARDGGAS
jgi:hypothetical protein